MDWLTSVWTYFAGPLVIALAAKIISSIMEKRFQVGKSFFVEWRKRRAISEFDRIAAFKRGDDDIHLRVLGFGVNVVMYLIIGAIAMLSAAVPFQLGDLLVVNIMIAVGTISFSIGFYLTIRMTAIVNRYVYFSQYKAELERRFEVNLDGRS